MGGFPTSGHLLQPEPAGAAAAIPIFRDEIPNVSSMAETVVLLIIFTLMDAIVSQKPCGDVCVCLFAGVCVCVCVSVRLEQQLGHSGNKTH